MQGKQEIQRRSQELSDKTLATMVDMSEKLFDRSFSELNELVETQAQDFGKKEFAKLGVAFASFVLAITFVAIFDE